MAELIVNYASYEKALTSLADSEAKMETMQSELKLAHDQMSTMWEELGRQQVSNPLVSTWIIISLINTIFPKEWPSKTIDSIYESIYYINQSIVGIHKY